MVKELNITLNPGPLGGHYNPGSTLTGSLTIEVDKPENYKTIEVYLLGKGKVEWGEGIAASFGTEEYVNKKLVLWRSENTPDGTFPVGKCTYPFEFVLPESCPPSFNSHVGKIAYKVKGLISTSLGPKFDHIVTYPFFVRESVSLAPSESVHVEKHKTVGYGLCLSGDINYSVQLPTTSFLVGEEIPVSWYVENGSDRRVTLDCSLQQVIRYFTETRCLLDVWDISSKGNVIIHPHSSGGSITMNIPIPPCHPTITCSNIIKSKFLLVATVLIPRSSDSYIEIPVNIGNQSYNEQEQSIIY